MINLRFSIFASVAVIYNDVFRQYVRLRTCTKSYYDEPVLQLEITNPFVEFPKALCVWGTRASARNLPQRWTCKGEKSKYLQCSVQ